MTSPRLLWVLAVIAFATTFLETGPTFCVAHNAQSSTKRSEKSPTVVIATLIRNKAHTLPYFLSYLEKLNYDKARISLWFRSDHNEDNSLEIVHIWLNKTSTLYHSVDFKYSTEPYRRRNESSITHWTKERFLEIIHLKETALQYARNVWADYIFFLDADVLLVNPDSLQQLISMHKPIVAPMLVSDGLYSNFWCGMSDDFYYQRTDEYKEIYDLKKRGEFAVPMVHSAVLVNLRDADSNFLTFTPETLNENAFERMKLGLTGRFFDGPTDDIIIFAISANYSHIPMYISNTHHYGYILVPLDQSEDIAMDYQQLINIRLLIINDLEEVATVSSELNKFISDQFPDKMSFSEIFVINLERRSERRHKMDLCFKELGLDVTYLPAVDGKLLTDDSLAELGVRFLPGYADPYMNRPMTLGEIGCFLSHYQIWQKIVILELSEVLILEDDIKFEPYFKPKSLRLIHEARRIGQWDMIYFGRKRLENQDEPWVDGANYLVEAGYSYWTLGYAITYEGAKKLLDARPLENMIPVDEFLPVVFDKHPNATWNHYFPNKNLIAWSAAPLLLFPTHYTGEEGYISDTEDSITIQMESSDAQKKGDKENLDLPAFGEIVLDDPKMDPRHTANFDADNLHIKEEL